MNSPTIPGTEGYNRRCQDCQGVMDWEWGGPITYFKCQNCGRVEPCANIVIEKGVVTKEEGNKKTVLATFPGKSPSEILKEVLP